MESSKFKFDFGPSGLVDAKADSSLFENVRKIYCEENELNLDEIYAVFKAKKTSVLYSFNNSKNGYTAAGVEFVKLVGQTIYNKYGNSYFFDQQANLFEKINNHSKKEFTNGTYYGYFKTSNDKQEGTTHFILIVKGKTVTVSSQFSTATGQFDEDNGVTYHALLRCSRGKINFFVGKKNFDYHYKTFLGTWTDEHDQMCCALCAAIYVSDSPYVDVADIERDKAKDHQKIHKEILSKKTKEIDDFLNKQEYKFIIQATKFESWKG